MARVEQRVARLEEDMREHGRGMSAVREALVQLAQRVGGLELRVDRLEQRVESGFSSLEARLSSQFVWLVSLQVTVLLAVISALISRL